MPDSNVYLLGIGSAVATGAVIIPLAFWLRKKLKPVMLRKLIAWIAVFSFFCSVGALYLADERLVVPIFIMVMMSSLLGTMGLQATIDRLNALEKQQAKLEKKIQTLKS